MSNTLGAHIPRHTRRAKVAEMCFCFCSCSLTLALFSPAHDERLVLIQLDIYCYYIVCRLFDFSNFIFSMNF